MALKTTKITTTLSYKLNRCYSNLSVVALSLLFLSYNINASLETTQFFKQQVHVNALIQDNTGYIWSGGQGHLLRFDGVSTIDFMAKSDYQAPFNWVNSLHIVKQDLYVATESNGLWKLDTATLEWTQITSSLDRTNIERVFVHDGSLYAVSRNEIYRVENDTQQNKPIITGVSILYATVLDSKLYYRDEHQLKEYNFKTQKTRTLTIQGKMRQVISNKNHVIASTTSHLYIFNEKERIAAHSLPSQPVALAFNSEQSKVTIAFLDGNYNTYSLSDLDFSFTTYNLETGSNITEMFIDNTDTLWVASSNGVRSFSSLSFEIDPIKFPIKYNEIGIEVVNDQILLSSWGAGIHNYSPATKRIDNIPEFNAAVPNAKVDNVIEHAGHLYIPTLSGLYQYSLDNKEVIRLIPTFKIQSFLSLKVVDNKLYVASDQGGMLVVDIKTRELLAQYEKENGLYSNEVIGINSGSKPHDLLIATAKGLNKFSIATKSISYIPIPSNAKIISTLKKNNKIYVTTLGSGVYILNEQYEIINHILHSTRVTGISDINHTLYVATRNGLYTINPNTDNAELIEGTRQLSFTNKVIQFKNNIMGAGFFGVITLPLKAQKQYQFKPVLTRITHNGKSVLPSEPLNVKSQNDVISFYLANFDFRDAQGASYQYRIGLTPWQLMSGNNITLSQLPPGENVIEFKSADSTGVWSSHIAFAQVNVNAPWYFTTLAIACYLLAFLLGMTVIAWLLVHKSRNTAQVRALVANESNFSGHTVEKLKYNLKSINNAIKNKQYSNAEHLSDSSLKLLSEYNNSAPSRLGDSGFDESMWILENYLSEQFKVNLKTHIQLNESQIYRETLNDIYRIVFETLMFVQSYSNEKQIELSIFNSNASFLIEITDKDSQLDASDNKTPLTLFIVHSLINKYQGTFNTTTSFDNSMKVSIHLTDINSLNFNEN